MILRKYGEISEKISEKISVSLLNFSITPMTTEITRIVNQLQRSYNGDAWHGTPLLGILQGITAEQAFMRPIANAHTIWELVLHITAWEGEVVRRLRTGESRLPEEGDWQEVHDTSQAAWNNALKRLREVHITLEQEMTRYTDDELDTTPAVPRVREIGSGVSLYVLLHGIVQHGIYHAGQIALLKKAVEK
jgi:uncharacterized damage-inducible protein DinB